MNFNNFINVGIECEKYKLFSKKFKKLRNQYGITETFYKNELSKSKFIIGSGKSGAKMWLSKNKIFFIKEISKSDKNEFKRILDGYFKYINLNKNTLLPKFFGIYKKENISYIVQKNLNPFKNGSWLYDLKGSHRTRTTINHTINKVGKDNNFGDTKILLNNSIKLKNQIKKDTAFLANYNLMDYSLFICLRDKQIKNKDWNFWGKSKYCCYIKGPGPSKPNPININMGIIDILQKYNIKKQIESYFKTKQHIKHRELSEVSAINPKGYKIRFDNYITNIFKNKKK